MQGSKRGAYITHKATLLVMLALEFQTTYTSSGSIYAILLQILGTNCVVPFAGAINGLNREVLPCHREVKLCPLFKIKHVLAHGHLGNNRDDIMK